MPPSSSLYVISSMGPSFVSACPICDIIFDSLHSPLAFYGVSSVKVDHGVLNFSWLGSFYLETQLDSFADQLCYFS